MNKDSCLAGGILFVLGLVALIQRSLDSAVLLMGLGLVFMAVGLGKEYVEKLYEFFKSTFEDTLDAISK